MVKPVVGAAAVLRSWLAKRQLRKLTGLDGYLLNDIGLTRDDLRHGLKLPCDVDPIGEMTAIREQRMARGARHR